MRRTSAVILALGLATAVAGRAVAAPPLPLFRTAPGPGFRVSGSLSATGVVRALSSTTITVGQTSCSTSRWRATRLLQGEFPLGAGFAVGQNVTIQCTGVPLSLSSIVRSPATSSSSGREKIEWSTGPPERTSTSTAMRTINVTGPISMLSGWGITIQNQTCAVEQQTSTAGPVLIPTKVGLGLVGPLAALFTGLQVGAQAHMTCTLLADGGSSDSITVTPASPTQQR